MGETEDKESPPNHKDEEQTEVQHNQQQQIPQEIDDAKETDKMLKKDDNQTNDDNEEKKDDEKKSISDGEILKAPENQQQPSKVTAQEREVKPRKIPIGGIKMPGFFTKTKPKSENDGAEGELLENAGNEAKVQAQEKSQNGGSFFSSIKIRNPFKRQPKSEDEEKGLTKEGKIFFLNLFNWYSIVCF